MQEPSNEKDDKYCTDLNKFINNPPQAGAEGGAGDDKGLGNLDQNQLLQFLANAQGGNADLSSLRALLQRGAGGQGSGATGTRTRPLTQASTTTTTASRQSTPTTTASARPTTSASSATSSSTSTGTNTLPPLSNATSDALKNIVANFAKDKVEPTLMDVINVDEIVKSGILGNDDMVKVLAEFLPEGPVNGSNIREHLYSNQFKEAVRNFNQALRSGELSTIAMSFGLDASNIGPNSSIEDFLMAIQKKGNEEKGKDEKQTNSK